MVRITKEQKDYLIKNGCKWHSDIHGSYSRNRTYYATEDEDILKILQNFNNQRTIETHMA